MKKKKINLELVFMLFMSSLCGLIIGLICNQIKLLF